MAMLIDRRCNPFSAILRILMRSFFGDNSLAEFRRIFVTSEMPM